ncbi:MAG: 4'-phosphopantetheinyl transferase superfamily protein, partial [Sphaerospermopsis sp. SIO1G2]|nr:4'-phosphopantetheinyl transferase superfamily protein [Sphaerospermopsis sp. SIO1G2]
MNLNSKPSIYAPTVDWRVPAERPSLTAESAHVWRVDLQQPDHIIKRLAHYLASDEQENANRFHFARDQRRYRVGRGALRLILSNYLSEEPHQHQFGYTKYGKPFLQNGRLTFNVTHSHETALIALHRHAEIGVDIEQVRPLSDMADLVQSVFTETEQQAWQRYDADERPWAFFAGWTRKESVIKALGQGPSTCSARNSSPARSSSRSRAR